jgi:hypothetical protein
MKITWCWRCQTEYPMLEDHEWSILRAAHQKLPQGTDAAFATLQRHAQAAGLRAPLEPPAAGSMVARRYWHLIAGFELFTGIVETSPNSIWHHHLSQYGPPCSQCSRLLRTPKAKICAACGAKVS